MNIIRMCGGLGNQMFQYALYLKFIADGVECVFDDWSEYEGHDNARPIVLKDAFGIDYPRADIKCYREFTDSKRNPVSVLKRKIFGRKSREYAEKPFCFDRELLELDNAYLTGYFQSEKYFESVKEKVLSEFTFTNETMEDARNLLKRNGIDFKLSDLTSVHIRRGDYLKVSDVYGGICTEEYYDRAVKYILDRDENAEFLIISNDCEWALEWKNKKIKENPKIGFKLHVLTGSDEDKGYIDMCIMQGCANNIIANSSFSFWGAYLNPNPGKIVLAPKRWTNLDENADIYTNNMVKI